MRRLAVLKPMSDIALAPPQPTETQAERFVPSPAASLPEAGVTPSLVEQLVLKNLYFRGEVGGRELARMLGFQFSVIEPVVDGLKRQRLVEVKRSLGFGNVSSQFALSEEGRGRAKDYLETNQFLGPAPVPLKDYVEAVKQQRVKPGWLTRDKLEKAFNAAVVTDEFYSKLGPAVNSFKSLLIYGRPGNGKSYLSEQLAKLESDPIYVPYVLEAEGQIISVVAWIGAETEFPLSQAVASGDAFEHRPSERGHCVQDFSTELDLRDLPGEAAEFEFGADDALPTAHLRFYSAALVVPCCRLPGHAPVAADLGNMAIPNGRITRRLQADHCVLWRWYDHIQGLPIPLPQQISCGRSIVGVVSQKARDRGIQLIQEAG